jgi:transcriptional regulator with XRE-family HTH domain
MRTGFGEKVAAIRRGLGIAQVYMANVLGLQSSKAVSRFEHDEGRYTDEQYETVAMVLGFSSAASLHDFDLARAIARHESERASGMIIDPRELREENSRLQARVATLEAELLLHKGLEQVLLDRIRSCEEGLGTRP